MLFPHLAKNWLFRGLPKRRREKHVAWYRAGLRFCRSPDTLAKSLPRASHAFWDWAPGCLPLFNASACLSTNSGGVGGGEGELHEDSGSAKLVMFLETWGPGTLGQLIATPTRTLIQAQPFVGSFGIRLYYLDSSTGPLKAVFLIRPRASPGSCVNNPTWSTWPAHPLRA